MDPLILILIAVWCGTPNLPMSSSAANKKIAQCLIDLINCYEVAPSSNTLVNCLQDSPKN